MKIKVFSGNVKTELLFENLYIIQVLTTFSAIGSDWNETFVCGRQLWGIVQKGFVSKTYIKSNYSCEKLHTDQLVF
jgi:hypothetical protein